MGVCRTVFFSIALLFVVAVCAQCANLSGLTLYVPFDDSVDAAVAAGDPKQQSEGVTYDFDEGVVGRAVIAGDSTKPLISYSVKDNIDQDNGSIAFWYKTIDWKGGDHVFFDIPNRVELYRKAGFGTFFDWFGAPQTNMIGWGVGGMDLISVPTEQGVWHHIVFTWNSEGFGYIYLDGKRSTETDNVPKGNAPKWVEGKLLRLADYTRTPDRNNKIMFDELMVFNRPLREAEARSLYRNMVVSQGQTKLLIGRLQKTPTLRNAAKEWENTAQIAGFLDQPFGFLSHEDVRANIGYDKYNIYVRVIDYSGKTGGGAEVLLAQKEGTAVNWLGVDSSSKLTGNMVGKRGVNAVVSRKPGPCVFEFKIPLYLVGPSKGNLLRMNIVRKWSDAFGDSVVWCSDRDGAYRTDPSSFALVEMGEDRPVMSLATLGQPYYCKYVFKANIVDPKLTKSKINVKTSLQPTNITEFYDPATIYGTRSLSGEEVKLEKDIITDKNSIMAYLEHSFTNLDMDSVKIEVTDEKGGVLYSTFRSFVPNPGILFSQDVYPTKNVVRALVDIGGYFGDKTGSNAEIDFIGPDGKTAFSKKIDKFEKDVAKFDIQLDKIPFGNVTIRSKLKQGNKLLASMDSGFKRLDDAPWVNSNLGYIDEVLPGFTPMTVNGQTVGMYNREYIWKDSLFPVQIISNGKELLYAPIEFSLGDKSLKPNPATVKVLEHDDQHVIMECKGQIGGVPVTVKHTMEYDGMCWSEMTFTPRGNTTFDRMTFFIVLNKDESTLFQSHYGGVGAVRGKGHIEGQALDGHADLYARPNYWFGNEEEGLTWFCEHWANWKVGTNPKPHKLRCDDESTTFATEISNVPVTFDKPFRLEFGIIATPIKPMPKNWRNWQCFRDFSFAWVGQFTPGNNEIATPKPEFKEYAAARRRWGQMFCVPYQRPDWTNINVPDYKYYAKEWSTMPLRFSGGDSDPNFRYAPVCLNSSWADYMLYYSAKAFDDLEMDGFYFDGAIPEYNGCQNTEHGCGWINENGVLRQSFPIRAYREFYKRLKVEFNKRGRPSWIYAHASSSVQLPTLSFTDLVLGGEEFSLKAPAIGWYSKFLGNDYIRANYNGEQYGLPMQLINELGADGSVPTIEATDDLLALMLPHGIGDLIYWNDSTHYQESSKYSKSILKNLGWFGVSADDCEFLPYWKNSEYISVEPVDDRIVCSVYKRPGKALLVIGNTTDSPQTVSVKLNKEKLGLPDELRVKSSNHTQTVTEANGVVTFDIAAARQGINWRIIYINHDE